jgi:hypothetical protein
VIEWDENNSGVVGTCVSKQLYISDTGEKTKIAVDITLGNGHTLEKIQSAEIKVISKPSKKSAKTADRKFFFFGSETFSNFFFMQYVSKTERLFLYFIVFDHKQCLQSIWGRARKVNS